MDLQVDDIYKLMDAIKDTLGKEYTPQVEAAWNKLYSVMSENMMDMKF